MSSTGRNSNPLWRGKIKGPNRVESKSSMSKTYSLWSLVFLVVFFLCICSSFSLENIVTNHMQKFFTLELSKRREKRVKGVCNWFDEHFNQCNANYFLVSSFNLFLSLKLFTFLLKSYTSLLIYVESDNYLYLITLKLKNVMNIQTISEKTLHNMS